MGAVQIPPWGHGGWDQSRYAALVADHRPGQIRHAVVAAAEAMDRKAETLPAPIVEAILAVRPRSLVRAIHRRQHLDQIERALAG